MIKLTPLFVAIFTATFLLLASDSREAGLPSKEVTYNELELELDSKDKSSADKFINLNRWLLENVSETESFEKNLQAAIGHLGEIKEDQKEHDVWVNFVNLAKITENNRCNLESVKILLTNSRNGLVNRTSNEAPQGSHKRAQRIVYKYLVEHAKNCEPIYEQKYREKRKTFDQSEFIMVSALAYQLRNGTKFMGIFRPGTKETNRFLVKISRLSADEMSKVAMRVIRKNHSLEQKDILKAQIARKMAKELVDQAGVEGLLQSLFDKCRAYVELFADTLGLAAFDAETSAKLERYGGEQLTGGIANFVVCKSFLKNRKTKDMLQGAMAGIPKRVPKYMPDKKKADSQSLQKKTMKKAAKKFEG